MTLGCISSFYYLHHKTVRLFRERLTHQASFEDLLQLLCVRSGQRLDVVVGWVERLQQQGVCGPFQPLVLPS